MSEADAAGELDWLVSIDSTIARAHPHAAGGRHADPVQAVEELRVLQGRLSNYKDPPPEPDDPALGQSRGGWTTKAHPACDGAGRPLSILLAGGNVNDTQMLAAVLDAIVVPRPGRCGRPCRRPRTLLADTGYSSQANRQRLRERHIPHAIPERADQLANRVRRGSSGGRPAAFDRDDDKRRNEVERFVTRIKQWQGRATHADKHAKQLPRRHGPRRFDHVYTA